MVQGPIAEVAASPRADGQQEHSRGGVVGMGWTSPEITVASFDAVWAALVCSIRSPEKFMKVSNIAVADRGGHVQRAMTVDATGTRVEENILTKESTGEMVFQVAASCAERVLALKERPLRVELYQRGANGGDRRCWRVPVSLVEEMIVRVVSEAVKSESDGKVIGLGLRSAEVKGVSHDALWCAVLESIREPERFFACTDVSIKECDGHVQRTLTVGGETYTESIFEDEYENEVVYRKIQNGAESGVERVLSLRSYPLQFDFQQRKTSDGCRAHWDMPRSAALLAVEALTREARRFDGELPTTIGSGVLSDPIRECSFDDLFAAIEVAVREPWTVVPVDRNSCEIKECEGFLERRLTLSATGERVVERVTLDEEAGEAIFRRCSPSPGGEPGNAERVLVVHSPLRLELFERDTVTGKTLDCKGPYGVARQAFESLAKLAAASDNA